MAKLPPLKKTPRKPKLAYQKCEKCKGDPIKRDFALEDFTGTCCEECLLVLDFKRK